MTLRIQEINKEKTFDNLHNGDVFIFMNDRKQLWQKVSASEYRDIGGAYLSNRVAVGIEHWLVKRLKITGIDLQEIL